MLSRRGFIGSLVGGLAATATVRTWPFRVFSFPSDIVVSQPGTYAAIARTSYPLFMRSGTSVALCKDLMQELYYSNLFNRPAITQMKDKVREIALKENQYAPKDPVIILPRTSKLDCEMQRNIDRLEFLNA